MFTSKYNALGRQAWPPGYRGVERASAPGELTRDRFKSLEGDDAVRDA